MQVLPLAVATPALLEQVFAEELGDWLAQLSWDYSSAVELIKRHISCRSLPGFFLTDGPATAAGYCYYVVSPPLGYLGNVFVGRDHASQTSYDLLITSAVRALQAHHDVRRIESQVFGFNCDVSPIMEREGYAALLRYFMTLPLAEASIPDGRYSDPPGFRMVPWDRGYFLPAADTIHDSYSGSPDHDMCYDYQSREGCVRFLRNLVDNPGCGKFSPETSRIALDTLGRVAGVLITSLISQGTGMIPQISIRKEAQGKGLGTALLTGYFQAAKERGLTKVTLSVSAQNGNAHRLYARLGFRETKDFYAFIWTRKA
ncbi:MAG: GNAT family N-acetyltransferase [Acidobacteria bacterium]|nr:MAG: GNAT family N-acetyltransferase [Acidobacteriota bacterium]